MNGTKTTTKTTTVNGVTTVVTTVTAPGQPTRITTTTTTKVPAGQQPTGKLPAQPVQPQPQGRAEPKRKGSGFFNSIKKQILRNDESPKWKTIFQQNPASTPAPAPAPAPVQIPQQKPQQKPQQIPQQKPQQKPLPVHPAPAPAPVAVIRPTADEKERQAALNRPTSKVNVEHHSSSVTTQNGHIIQQSNTNSSYSSDGPDDAIAMLKKCRPMVASDFKGKRLEINAIDFSREDAHARACPSSETSSIERLSHYLTSPCTGDQVSQLRTIYTWITHNIAYDVPAFLAGRYGDQSAEAVLRNRVGVCEGYANLFVALAQPAGLNVEKVIGLARGVDIQVGDERLGSSHAWNSVTVNGEHLLIDATWGAGVCDLSTRSFRKLFRPFFFLLRPNKLIYTHWPENPKQQYLNPPVDEKVFRGLPAIKPEAWGLGIKLAGKNRGQVIRTKDDSIEIEVRLKKLGPNGSTGKIVARLNWKGQSNPATVQWLREDDKYVWMVVKSSCPSSGTGELNVFGWPPGGDQTKNGPQCLCFKVINEGSGKTAKAPLQQYVVKGFSFSVLEPISAEVNKGVSQTIRVKVFDVEKGITPALAIQSPEGGMPERLTQVQPGLFEIKKVLSGGQWKIVHMTSEYGFSFAAVFDAV
ncbi:hypothetical protein BGX27_007770 [Mortierella sp. AM989]|nr:hypothetical protein BGX27_007770 [Mortierella sp. AM989]